MADISKITTLDGTIYDIKDSIARTTLTNLPFLAPIGLNPETGKANQAFNKGDLCIINGELCIVSSSVSAGGTLLADVPTNGLSSWFKYYMWELIYPVGSIYMSVNSTSPATLFGGTWVQLKDQFLLGAGDTYTAGDTGGATSQSYTPAGTVGNHTLTTAEIPSHAHGMNSHVHSVGAHVHGLNGHVHSVGAHAHGLNGHVHSVGAHAHGLNSHTHTGPSHTHGTGKSGNGHLGFCMFYTNGDPRATGVGFEAKGDGGDYYASYEGTTGSAGTGNTGAATGSTANSSAFNSGGNSGNTANSTAFNSGGNSGNTANSTAFNSGAATGNTANAGSGEAHNHGFTGTAATITTMPPYTVVYMWKRTA